MNDTQGCGVHHCHGGLHFLKTAKTALHTSHALLQFSHVIPSLEHEIWANAVTPLTEEYSKSDTVLGSEAARTGLVVYFLPLGGQKPCEKYDYSEIMWRGLEDETPWEERGRKRGREREKKRPRSVKMLSMQ